MGRDAAEIKPKLIPDDQLLPRDNSGGLDYTPHTAEWDDGGKVIGAKSHLSAGDSTGNGSRSDERERQKVIGRDRKSD